MTSLAAYRHHFATLNLAPTTDFAAVKKAYNKKALQLHPDKNICVDTKAAFQDVLEAYETLRNILQTLPVEHPTASHYAQSQAAPETPKTRAGGAQAGNGGFHDGRTRRPYFSANAWEESAAPSPEERERRPYSHKGPFSSPSGAAPPSASERSADQLARSSFFVMLYSLSIGTKYLLLALSLMVVLSPVSYARLGVVLSILWMFLACCGWGAGLLVIQPQGHLGWALWLTMGPIYVVLCILFTLAAPPA